MNHNSWQSFEFYFLCLDGISGFQMWGILKITKKKEGYVAKTPSVVDVLCLPKQKV